MKIVDLHCDALMKFQLSKGRLNFENSPRLDVNYQNIKKGNIWIQAFAIFIDPEIPLEKKFEAALEQIKFYHSHILARNKRLHPITAWEQIKELKEGEIGTFLTLEGVDAIGDDLSKLEKLLDLGVLSVGLTWNNANYAADGVGEPRGAGLTEFGYQIVQLLNERHCFTDVSHLSVNGFWDVMEVAKYPIASHSNAKAIWNHRRNLDDEQIKKMIEKEGLIHVVFCPRFTHENTKTASIQDLLPHIDHLLALGAENIIGFGSDFDGVMDHFSDLKTSADYPKLIETLEEIYAKEIVQKIAYQNFLNHLPK
ncbi:dipeptidase [Vagococcus entomophilus]|uniref:Diguanylate cyclase n=1 Tax=Vagococcus entomophilus TaxID=1160095 RepID=A0A430AJC9_9ENTE|nr:dipeptidase [Vagococcus entomophilus]RSU08212.1 diguanylate cyclase [Vagococcus entomophilus]